VDGIQRIYDGGWDPSVESGRHKSVNVWIWANYCTWPTHLLYQTDAEEHSATCHELVSDEQPEYQTVTVVGDACSVECRVRVQYV
jgi:hypothetical protein